MCTVVNMKTEQYDIAITRPSKWGNPFRIDQNHTREEVIKSHLQYVVKNPYLLASLEELKGKRLGCVCKPLACHGDNLVALTKYYHPDNTELWLRPAHLVTGDINNWYDIHFSKSLSDAIRQYVEAWISEKNGSYFMILKGPGLAVSVKYTDYYEARDRMIKSMKAAANFVDSLKLFPEATKINPELN